MCVPVSWGASRSDTFCPCACCFRQQEIGVNEPQGTRKRDWGRGDRTTRSEYCGEGRESRFACELQQSQHMNHVESNRTSHAVPVDVMGDRLTKLSLATKVLPANFFLSSLIANSGLCSKFDSFPFSLPTRETC